MDDAFKVKFSALVKEGLNSNDEDTRKFAVAANLLLSVEGFGPAVFEAFFEQLAENVSSLEKLAGAMKAAAEDMGI